MNISKGKVDREVIKKQILPVAALFALSLVLSNKAYIYLSVSYIQVSMCHHFSVCSGEVTFLPNLT